MFWLENRTIREWDRTVRNMKVLTGRNMPLSRAWQKHDIKWRSLKVNKISLEGKKKRKDKVSKPTVVWQARNSILECIIIMYHSIPLIVLELMFDHKLQILYT